MDIGDWHSTRDLNPLYREIRALGLETNLAELDAFGFTTIPDALSPSLTRSLRDGVLRIAQAQFGTVLDLDNERELHDWKFAPYLLFRDRAFEQAVLNPKPLALITYLLGQSCLLSSLSSHVKGPGGPGLLLHADTGNGVPAPLSPYSHVANCNYALVDYTEDNGALAMVPGSHRYFRQPNMGEIKLDGPDRNRDAIPIEVPAGTAIVWHGNTWHGSFPRKRPGLRINLSMYFCRQYLQPQENYRDHIPAEFQERHPPDSRFATLLGIHTHYGWGEAGPTITPRSRLAGRSWHS
jgi:ectoine hydroxylase-related dioxygenase (phytanoyl-CoA dioxygenase family)